MTERTGGWAGWDRARDETYPTEGSHVVSTGLETTYVGAGVEMTPFLISMAAVLDKTASIYGIMAACPHLPRRKEVASSAKGSGSLIGSQYDDQGTVPAVPIACWKRGTVFLPLDGTPSTHIIKTAIRDYPDSVENECFSMKLAEAALRSSAGAS